MIPTLLFAQPSWVRVEFQSDTYGGESTWNIYPVGSDESVASGGPYGDSTYFQQTIPLPSDRDWETAESVSCPIKKV